VNFITRHWRAGARGAFRMGVAHGLYCLGCCWALMLLLFVGGVMNLWVIAAITLFVLLEKVSPRGVQAGRLSGILLILLGAWTVFR
jgi:predicted metal-binding membrane protein